MASQFHIDAAHSLSSMVVDLVTLACVSICRRPPNKKWVFGYGKIETVFLPPPLDA